MIERTVVPLGKNILIEVVEHNKTSLILEKSKGNMDLFDMVVVAVGPDCVSGVKVGDVVIAGQGARMLSTCMEDHCLIHDSDIMGIEKISVGNTIIK